MSRRVEPAAAIGFDRQAGTYAAVRPTYPGAAVSALGEAGVLPGAMVCDLAAGTGIFSRLLRDAGYDVVAIEPVEGMRSQLAEDCDDIAVLDGTAESIPMADGSCAAVTVAQAFHWFDEQPALAEIHRVLVPDGVLLMVWNVRDESVRWVRRWTDVVNTMSGGRPYSDHRERPWAEVVAASGRFTPLQSRRVRSDFRTTPAAVVERTLSTSFVAALDDEPRQAVLDAVAGILADDEDTAGRASFVFPNMTDIHWCRRLD